MKHFYFLSFLFCLLHTNVTAQLSVSATQVAGTCVADAQINVTGVNGLTPYQFRLQTGPAGLTYPTAYQSGTNFSGLKAGSYTVQVRDNTGALATANISVTTSYVNLVLSTATSTASTCAANPNGTVTITRTGGKASYSYSLLQGATVKYGPQPSTSFTGIADGTYTAQVVDGCGEIRTFSVTVALTDYKWNSGIASSDNFLANYDAGNAVPSKPFDTTKTASVGSGPLLFTCDSIAFRIYNALEGGASKMDTVLRRVYIVQTSTNTIVWDNTFKPSDWAGTSPTVKLKINTDYRFYFDDLCNDIVTADRNYNYSNTDNYSVVGPPGKTCAGYTLGFSLPSNWNNKNRYNSPYDTITVTASTLVGDTTVGKTILVNRADVSLTTNPIRIPGITPGQTYTVQIKTLCKTYTLTRTIGNAIPLSITVVPATGACKLNTANLRFSIAGLAQDTGNFTYRINSGPASFTDANGVVRSMTYPVTGTVVQNSLFYLRNFPEGTYSFDFWDQCGNTVPTFTYIVTSADVLKLTANISANQQCPGASSITYTTLSSQMIGNDNNYRTDLQQKQANGTYLTVSPLLLGIPPSRIFSGLADGEYRVIAYYNAINNFAPGPLSNSQCDVLFQQDITLAYKLPVLDSATGFICTPGGSDGKITLFGKNGARLYQFQIIDAGGTPVTAYQTDSTFTGLQAGLYRFRMQDNCGNATIYSYQLDTLKNPVINVSTTCPTPGSSFTLTADSNYNASYTWVFTPTGGGSSSVISNSRISTINSLTPADYGTYTVTYTIPGCGTAKSAKVVVGNCLVVLPVTLKYFNAQIVNCKTVLNWQSATEVNFRKYQIEYSTNGTDFTAIGTIMPKGDNSQYSYTYQASQEGKSFFRLKMIDVDGSNSYSKTLYLNGNCNSSGAITVYPNPVKDKITISGLTLKSTLRLLTLSGQEAVKIFTANTTYELNMSKYPKGIYFLQISGNDSTIQTIKINKE